MDDIQGRYAQELVDAVNAAVAGDSRVQACVDRARADGLDLRIVIDAQVESAGGAGHGFVITAADRRFLRALRIAADS